MTFAWGNLRSLLFIAGFVLSVPLNANDQSVTLRLLTHDLKPYSYLNEAGVLTGNAVNMVHCAFERLQTDVEIEVVPWTRAQYMVQSDLAEGFFAASQQSARDEFAQLTHSIADQNWVWFWSGQSEVTLDQVISSKDLVRSSFHGANMQTWLETNDYQVLSFLPETTEQLIRMVITGRIEVGMANQSVLESILKRNSDFGFIEQVIAKEKPLGIYIRNTWLAERPTFMSELNKAIDDCHTITPTKG